jgi:PadR family transcriptional regulator, regulatory protein AphA
MVTTTEAALLGLLQRGELSGYDMRKWIASSVGYFWSPAKTQIYEVLPRLVDEGLATSRVVAQRERPDKVVYRITKRGTQALRDWLEHAPLTEAPSRNTLLLKIFFGDLAPPEVLLAQIREAKAGAERLRDELRELDEYGKTRPGDEFPALTRRYGFEYAEGIIRWAEAAERALGGKGAA